MIHHDPRIPGSTRIPESTPPPNTRTNPLYLFLTSFADAMPSDEGDTRVLRRAVGG